MKLNSSTNLVLLQIIAAVLLCFALQNAIAHPADDLCDSQAMVDIQLCSELSKLDRGIEVSTDDLPEIELNRSPFETFVLYVRHGFEHILPMGVDHLAFVLALILAATSLRILIIQISIFTLAHSITLALGFLGVVVLNSVWVEVIIALSIAFVAIENLFFKFRLAWRSVIVFCFGLLHGLGFAGALSELGVPDDHFVTALVGFNVGVELGQLSFGLVVFFVLHKLISKKYFKQFVYIPGNILVAIAGIYWLVERLS